MALVSTGGIRNIESDVALASTAALTLSRVRASTPVRILSITCGPISTATGEQCGIVDLKDGATVIWRGYVRFTATAAAQSDSEFFELDAVFTPAGTVTVLYTAVTDATTASVNVVWEQG